MTLSGTQIFDFLQGRLSAEEAERIGDAAFEDPEIAAQVLLLSNYVDSCPRVRSICAELLMAVGHYWDRQEDAYKAFNYFNKALLLRVEDNIDPSECLGWQGIELLKLGESESAVEFTQQALRLIEDQGQQETEETLTLRRNLGVALEENGQFQEAINCFQDVLDRIEALYGKDDMEYAAGLKLLGFSLHTHGQHEKSLYYLEGAFRICETRVGLNHIETANSLRLLGKVLVAAGRHGEAVNCLSRALNIYQRLEDSDRSQLAVFINDYACGLMTYGALERARQWFHKGLEVSSAEQVATPTSLLTNLGLTYYRMHDYQRAIEFCTKAFEACDAIPARERWKVAGFLNNLALPHANLGDNEKSAGLLREAIAIYEAQLGGSHERTIIAKHNLSIVLDRIGESEESVVLVKFVKDRTHLLTREQQTGVNRGELISIAA
jgi:tetratricopeptide (TPR) repeat protein